ncbi:MAG: tRNA (adenosine(37)-N6)-dimethylallyltransferase MiaA [Clostridiales bacterium]|nr:tRNA (adenosine(37)-N6)-dimethylallyltransferase MiaA [Clostridiales bacterium]
MEPVIVIAGPTASGKSAVAIELAKLINGEIISADSMQIYKHMDIGTAKPSDSEMKGIKHYLIDEVAPDQEFSVARFQELALAYIKEIIAKGKHPIVVGGTGLYINSLVYNISFSETKIDWELREALRLEAIEKGNRYLHEKLKEMDPEAAARLHENDVKRVIRAIEVFTQTKTTMSEHIDNSRLIPPPYNYIVFGLNLDRQRLYRRIEERIDLMLENGLVGEVKKLVELGYDKNSVAMQGLGYKEILSYLRGETSLDEAVDILKMDTRRYAKRQITWFKRTEGIQWIEMEQGCDYADKAKIMQSSIASF